MRVRLEKAKKHLPARLQLDLLQMSEWNLGVTEFVVLQTSELGIAVATSALQCVAGEEDEKK